VEQTKSPTRKTPLPDHEKSHACSASGFQRRQCACSEHNKRITKQVLGDPRLPSAWNRVAEARRINARIVAQSGNLRVQSNHMHSRLRSANASSLSASNASCAGNLLIAAVSRNRKLRRYVAKSPTHLYLHSSWTKCPGRAREDACVPSMNMDKFVARVVRDALLARFLPQPLCARARVHARAPC
jgi:hypothetical protein